jgi:ribonuclease P protein component
MAYYQFAFPKQEHLCSENRIADLFLNGESFMSYPLRVVWLAYEVAENSEIRVVMSVSKKKLRHAVDRNRVKRLLRETYRLNKRDLRRKIIIQGLSLSIVFIWIPNEVLNYAKVEKKMKEALNKLEKIILEKDNTLGISGNVLK